MTGYTQLNPDNGEICQLISFKNAPAPLKLQQQPTIFERLAEQDVRVTSSGLPKFAFSALRRYVAATTSPMTIHTDVS